MLKMFRYVKERWYYIVFIILLLFLQAMGDLSLPDYTSKIVNVGIQQKGIEDSVPSKIRKESMENLFLFMDDNKKTIVEDNYTLEDKVYVLNKVSEETRTELSSSFGIPMMIVNGMLKDSTEMLEMKKNMGLPKDTDLLQVFRQMPPEQFAQVKAEMAGSADKFAELPDSLITQSAITYIQQEYTQMGISLNKMQTDYVVQSGLRMLGITLLIMAASILVTFLSCQVAADMGRHLRNSVYRKVLSFSGNELNQFSTASLITRSTNDIQQVQMLMTMLFRIILYAPILGVGGIIKVFQTETSMTWILGLAVVLIMLLVGFLFMVAMPRFKMLQKLVDKLNLVTREILNGITVIRAFSTQAHEEKRFGDANEKLAKTQLFVNRCMTIMMPTIMLIMNLVSVLIIYNGAHAVNNGTMQVGNMMAFLQYAMQIIMSFLMLTMLSIMWPRASVSADRINEVLETEVVIHDPEQPQAVDSAIKGLVEFKNVSFEYPGAKEKVLSNISFTAKQGETVAFIGSTGSGKSTLINLIPRLYDVTEGSVMIDGVDVRNITLKTLRDKIGYVPQKGVLFSGTIDSNIRYGREEASSEEIKKAAEIAQAWDFISEKAQGLDAPISQGGTNVSGGQKQRLSIARAIAKRPEIYIFDDSFSALDYQTDVVLRRALKKETKEATTLIVAQRISTILHADRIIVLDEGIIVGQGTHRELLKTCDVYKQIAMSQLSEEELANE